MGGTAESKRKWRTKLIILALALCVLAGGAITIAIAFRKESVLAWEYRCSGITGGRGCISITGVQQSATRRIGSMASLFCSDLSYATFPAQSEDKTVFQIQHEILVWEFQRRLSWFYVMSIIRGQNCDHPLKTTNITTLGTSDTLFVRRTPDGMFYVSTSEDRAHMVHEGLFADDASLEQNVRTVFLDHWAPWVAEMDETAQKPSVQGMLTASN